MKQRTYRRGELAHLILSGFARHHTLSDMIGELLARRTNASGAEMSAPRKINEGKVAANKQSFRTTVSKLRRQGMLENKDGLLTITRRGLAFLNARKKKEPLMQAREYKKEKGESPTIVAFDIPERFRARRAMLREALGMLDYKLLQQSVWIGKNKIPAEFLEDLRDAGIIRFVHIFEVKKEGTILQ